jgi:DNA-binding MarR family transcriptional regulator
LTKHRLSGIVPEMPREPVTAIQRHYPQIYLACHVDHVRAGSTPHRLSAKDSMLLAHLDEEMPVRAGDLARHLGVAASTLSATMKRLRTLGYLRSASPPGDARVVELRLTAAGAGAIAATSVLDRRHVAGVLAQLDASARQRAVDGLALLARAATSYRRSNPTRRTLHP